MLNQAVLSFLNKAENDATLKNRLSGIGPDEISKLAGESDYNFTGDDWAATLSGILAGEINEGDLGQVAGGGGTLQPSLGISQTSLKLLLPNANGSAVWAPQ
jgi:predicted ribosomally synthesized peptide with nif11-like leader